MTLFVTLWPVETRASLVCGTALAFTTCLTLVAWALFAVLFLHAHAIVWGGLLHINITIKRNAEKKGENSVP